MHWGTSVQFYVFLDNCGAQSYGILHALHSDNEWSLCQDKVV
jgi:hypothetical protein